MPSPLTKMQGEEAAVPTFPDLARSWLDQAPLPMAAVEGPRHVVRYINPAFCRLLDKTRGELRGKPFCELLPNPGDCLTWLDRVYHSGEPASHAEEQASPEQRILFWSYSLWPVRELDRPMGVMIQITETGKFHERTVAVNEALLLGALRQHELTTAAAASNAQLRLEIDERQQVEEALHQAQAQLSDRAGQLEALVSQRTAELTATNKQMEAFIYSIAHDLRAPLRCMQGFSALLVEEAGTSLNTACQGHAQRIAKSAHFMDALVTDLLAFSRISQQHVELAATDLATVADSVRLQLRKDFQEKNARLENAGPWPKVLAHEPTLTQVLFNLVSNALKFAAPGVSPVVRLRAEETAGVVRVWVEDNGIGIDPRHHAQIFGLFIRLHGGKYPGTGVGLAIVQQGLERMGGRAGVESVAGQGSRFWLELKQA